MSYNDKKILNLILEEIEQVDEQYDGYKDDIKEIIAEIVRLEREHTISRINIVQKISDQISKVATNLNDIKN